MRLLVLAEDFYPNISGGAHTRWRFCQLAAERGHEITVFTPRGSETPANEQVDDVEICRPYRAKPASLPAYSSLARMTRALFSVLLFFHLAWWLQGKDFDGIHSASTSMHWVGKGLSLLYEFPLVTFIGYTPSVSEDQRLSFQLLRERIAVRLFMGDIVFCRLERVRRVLTERTSKPVRTIDGILQEPRIRTVARTVDRDRVRDRFDLDGNDRLLLFVGRLVPVKNPAGALGVVEALPETHHLLIVGEGPERSTLQQLANERGLTDRVRFLGELPHDETLEMIAAADVLVVTSDIESYGTAALEALALSTPVASTPVGVLTEMDHDRVSLASIEDLPRVLESMDRLGTDELDEDVLEQYSMTRYTDTILEAFAELVSLGTGEHNERRH